MPKRASYVYSFSILFFRLLGLGAFKTQIAYRCVSKYRIFFADKTIKLRNEKNAFSMLIYGKNLCHLVSKTFRKFYILSRETPLLLITEKAIFSFDSSKCRGAKNSIF